MPNRSLTIEQVLTLLAKTLPRIASLTSAMALLNYMLLPLKASGPQMMCLPICVLVLTCGATVLL